MKKQFVNGYGKDSKVKERLVIAGLAGVCIVAFVITVTVANLIMDTPGNETDATKVIAEEDIAYVEEEEENEDEAVTYEPEVAEPLEETAEAAAEPISFVAPCSGGMLKEFSDKVPIYSETLDDWRVHTAIDIGAPIGSEVRAVSDGVVADAYDDFRHGYTIAIEHEGGIRSIYSNLASISMVEVGSNVKRGQQISTVGDTTLFETVADTHLHMEMTVNGVYVNPLDYFSLTE